jgi:Protein of unknown function (DUF1573)
MIFNRILMRGNIFHTSIFMCVFAISGVLFFWGRSWGSGTDDLPPLARITPEQVDLGVIQLGKPVKRAFVLQNLGDKQLLVTDVRSTCKCTVPELLIRMLPPRTSAPLLVTFTGNFTGKVRPQVLVRTNDPQHPVLGLMLEGNVIMNDPNNDAQAAKIAPAEVSQ